MKIMIQYLSYCTRELGNLILRKAPKPIADLKLKSSKGINQVSSNQRNQYTHRCFKERFLERCKGITLVCKVSAHEQLFFIL